MKRDFDLIREILLAAEAQDENLRPAIAPQDYTNAEIKYHIQIMVDGRLLKQKQHPDTDLPAPVFDGLTWEGHEFLDAIRESGTWSKVKKAVREKSVGLSYESIKVAVSNFITAALSG